MSLRSPSRSKAEYTTYEFTAAAGFDYNYDPSGSRTPHTPSFDPYTDAYASPPASDTYTHDARNSPVPPISTATPAPTSPSPEYLSESEQPSTRLRTPSAARKLLILDLNGTLVYRSPHTRREFRPRRRQHTHNHGRDSNSSFTFPDAPAPVHAPDPYADPTAIRPLRTVHARPYMPSFREYLFHPSTRAWLDTMVWSSAQPHSVADMVDRCFGEARAGLVAVWARDTLGLQERDYHRKTQTTKDLSKPWAQLPLVSSSSSSSSSASTPTTTTYTHESPQAHSAHTTLLLDDSPLKAHLQPWNHLCIREYSGTLRNADLQQLARERAVEMEMGRERDGEGRSALSTTWPAKAEDAHTDADPHDPDASAPHSHPPKKRKRPKKIKGGGPAAAPLLPAAEIGFLGSTEDEGGGGHAYQYPYDPTLLAVVGVLERLKWEANVAGWMRAGGLRASSPPAPSPSDVPSPQPPPSPPASSSSSPCSSRGSQRQDGADSTSTSTSLSSPLQESNAPPPPSSSSPPPSPPPPPPSVSVSGTGTGKRRRLSDPHTHAYGYHIEAEAEQEAGEAGEGEEGGEGDPAAKANIGDSGQWFADRRALAYWVREGVRALGALGVGVVHGVRG